MLVSEVPLDGHAYEIRVAAPMKGFYRALNAFKWLILTLSPFLLILPSAGGYWMRQRAWTTADGITRAAQNINAKNRAKRFNAPQSGGELERLSVTLKNGLLERPEAACSRIT